MPLFEYKCKQCGHMTEVLERRGSRARRKCEKCGSPKMEKVFSTFGVGKTGASAGDSCPTGTCSLS